MVMQTEGIDRSKFATKSRMQQFGQTVWRYRYMYLLVLPGVIYFVVFKGIPTLGLILAFQDYNPTLGFFNSEWVGLKHFQDLFASSEFYIMLRNTMIINILALVFFFPLPIVLAIMLNEVRNEVFKRVNQTIVYLPHFLSWVVIVSLTFILLSVDVGVINKVIRELGFEHYSFLNDSNLYWGILTLQTIWKDVGWGTILFLAAIAGVNPEKYEAAVIDGANRLQQIWHVTLPAIRPTIVILLILQLGKIADVNLEQVILMYKPLVRDVAEVFDTYVYYHGIMRGQHSLGVAVGFFKGLVGLVLIMGANYVVKRMGDEGIY